MDEHPQDPISNEHIAALDTARMRRDVAIRALVHAMRKTLRVRDVRADVDTEVENYTSIEATDKTVELLAPFVEAWEVMCQIVYASDGCVGHRGCAHSMEPWKRARALMMAEDERQCDEIRNRR